MRTLNNLNSAVLVLLLGLLNSTGTTAIAKDTVTEMERYWRFCEEAICDVWILDIQVPPALQPYKEECVAALEFDLLQNGRLKRIRIRHSNGEKYLRLQKRPWTTRAISSGKQLDKHMIAALKHAGPFPPPPPQLNYPRHCLVIFDFRSPHLVKLLLDDGITAKAEMLDFIF